MQKQNTLKKICFLGAINSIHFRKFVQYFRQRCFETAIITFHPTAEGIAEDLGNEIYCPTILPAAGKLNYFLSYSRVRALMRKISPDLVFALGATGYGFVASIAAPVPYVLRCQGTDVLIQAQQSGIFKWITRKAINNASRLISVSKPMTAALRKMGIADSQILETQMGIDFDVFYPIEKPSNGSPVIICNRMLEPIYNYPLIIEAVSLLSPEYPELRIKIVTDGYLRDELTELMNQKEVLHHFDFVGYVANPTMADYLRQGDVYLSASLSDGTSMSLLEAMASGITPVVSDIPANRDWVEDGINGFLFPTDDAEKLAGCVRQALENPGLRKTIAQNNLNLMRQRGSFQERMVEVENLFIDALM